MAKPIFVPLYLADYAQDTQDLSMVEDGAYWRLLRYYFAKAGEPGGIPDDMGRLVLAVRAMNPEQVAAVEHIVELYFYRRDGRIRHRRADETLASVADKREKATMAANIRHGNAPPEAPKVPPKEKAEPVETPAYSAGFEAFWKAYPGSNKGSKFKAFDKWKRLRLEAKSADMVADVSLRAGSHRPWLEGFVPHVTTFLSGRLWEAEIDRSATKTVAGRSGRAAIEEGNRNTAESWAGGQGEHHG